jgi:flavin reductase (DIM6/NTAB) family NADH-FMN oxidoreductase RutF
MTMTTLERSRIAFLGEGSIADSSALAEQQSTDLNDFSLRQAFGRFPSGVVALCGTVNDEVVGMTISSYTSVSLHPPLVAVFIDRGSSTWPKLQRSEGLGLTVFAEGQGQLCRQLSRRGVERFDGVPLRRTSRGPVFVKEACLWLDCDLDRQVRTGDHDLVLLRVRDFTVNEGVPPLVFHGSAFRSLSPES